MQIKNSKQAAFHLFYIMGAKVCCK